MTRAKPAATTARPGPVRLSGTPGSPGIAIGPIWRYQATTGFAGGDAGGRPAEISISDAATLAASQLEGLAGRVRTLGRAEEAEILEAQALMAADSLLIGEAERLAGERGSGTASVVAGAVIDSAAALAAQLAAIDDEVLAARAADVRDVGGRIAGIILRRTVETPATGSIAVADDLPPTVTVELPPGALAGIATEAGTRTAHAAILARALGIPAVVGVSGLGEAIDGATHDGADAPLQVAIDGDTGEVIVAPGRREIRVLESRRRALVASRRTAQALPRGPGATADGQPVRLLANIGRPDEADGAIEAGAEGVGLFRTEFMYMGRSVAPSEDEQVEAYQSVLARFGPDRPVVIRLADIGGDKAVPYLGIAADANPFLGVRGLRLAYTPMRSLLVTQIRAISRAGKIAGAVPHVMAPMVATLEDVQLLAELRAEAEAGLDADGVPRSDRMVTGIMVEVPAAALLADRLAPHVEFFSIGTNDLTQYVLAADRTSASLGSLQDALHPAVLALVKATALAAQSAGISVAVCGQLASDPLGALVLVGLGVGELSMEPASLDATRYALHSHASEELRELAQRALAAETAAQVREMAFRPS